MFVQKTRQERTESRQRAVEGAQREVKRPLRQLCYALALVALDVLSGSCNDINVKVHNNCTCRQDGGAVIAPDGTESSGQEDGKTPPADSAADYAINQPSSVCRAGAKKQDASSYKPGEWIVLSSSLKLYFSETKEENKKYVMKFDVYVGDKLLKRVGVELNGVLFVSSGKESYLVSFSSTCTSGTDAGIVCITQPSSASCLQPLQESACATASLGIFGIDAKLGQETKTAFGSVKLLGINGSIAEFELKGKDGKLLKDKTWKFAAGETLVFSIGGRSYVYQVAYVSSKNGIATIYEGECN